MKVTSPLLINLAAGTLVGAIRALFHTCRVETLPAGGLWRIGYEQDEPSELFLYSIWHDLLLFPIFARRCKNMAALVSQHRDGSLLADVMHRLEIEIVRGSTSQGGARAVRQLMTSAAGRHISITPDGPRGPRRVMKSGVVYLASRTGRAIIPTGYSASRSWSIRGSWTDLRVPKPMSTIYLLGGEPIRVPAGLSRGGIAHYEQLVQREMDHLCDLAERLARGEAAPESQAYRAA
ncbi:MAG: lysophospholipid acyltransferase family protein [Pirellulaceae bacterium]